MSKKPVAVEVVEVEAVEEPSAPPSLVTFHSPIFTRIHLDTGHVIDFRNGHFTTSDEAIIEALRRHPHVREV